MADPYFYCPDIADVGSPVGLSREESRHLSGARRYRTGDTIWLFDGRGTVARGTLIDSSKTGATVTVQERRHEAAAEPVLHLACALPKGDRLSTLLDMATQLGMASFTPLRCERSVAVTAKQDRLVRICLEACKQSRQSVLPVLHEAATPDEFVQRATASGSVIWIAHDTTDATPIVALLADQPTPPKAIAVLVGPEGGFSPPEIDRLCGSGGRMVSLGTTVLRIETAAVAILAAIRLTRHASNAG